MKIKIILNKKEIGKLDLSGRGGKESIFTSLLYEYNRVSSPLYDFVSADGYSKIEIKKQQNLQWFDVGKYFNLTADEKNIIMMFINHIEGKIQSIYTILLDEFIEILCSDVFYQKDGWTKENIKMCNKQKIQFPSMQTKVKVRILTFVSRYSHKVTKLF